MLRSEKQELLDAARALVIDTTAGEVVKALADAGIKCFLLRGPSLASLLYDSVEERFYEDVDLLIEPGRLADAELVLANRGFAESALEAAFPDGRPSHAHTWRAPNGAAVDLHRTLIGVDVAPEAAWPALSSGSETIVLHGVAVQVPSVPARALIVALHAAHHVDDAGSAMRDLERALARLSWEDWSDAARLAREVGAVEAFAAGLQLSPGGRAELSQLGLEPSGGGEPETMKGGRSFHVAQGIFWLEKEPGIRAKARFLRRRLLPSPRSMRQRSVLARRGSLGLALSYAARWADAVGHLPGALAALRRIRR